jgi:hypothetical protein
MLCILPRYTYDKNSEMIQPLVPLGNWPSEEKLLHTSILQAVLLETDGNKSGWDQRVKE